jgi:hypothetical protein
MSGSGHYIVYSFWGSISYISTLIPFGSNAENDIDLPVLLGDIGVTIVMLLSIRDF